MTKIRSTKALIFEAKKRTSGIIEMKMNGCSLDTMGKIYNVNMVDSSILQNPSVPGQPTTPPESRTMISSSTEQVTETEFNASAEVMRELFPEDFTASEMVEATIVNAVMTKAVELKYYGTVEADWELLF